MLYKSAVFSVASGSVAGCTFSRNRYGSYVRNRSLPVNPNTPPQVASRAIFAALSIAWNVDLDAGERTAWDAYALAVPRLNSVGEVIFTTGLNWFIACNAPLLLSGNPRNDVAPSVHNMTALTKPTLTVVGGGAISVGFDNTDEWATVDGGFLHLSYAQPVNESVNYFTGPFRYSESIVGDTTTPPTSPFTGGSPFPYFSGQRVFLRALAQAADGRISVPTIVSATAS